MRKTLATIAVIIFGLPAVAYAQDPCVNPPTSTTFNPTKVYVVLPEQTTMEADGVTPRVSNYEFGYYKPGDDPATATPQQGTSTIPRTAATAAPGSTTANCFVVDVPAPIPTGQVLVGALRARRLASGSIPAAVSGWTPTSNPFASAPIVLVTPGRPVIR